MLALAIVAEGDGACKIAYCRVCLEVFKQNIGRGRKRVVCGECRHDQKLRQCQRCGATIKPGSYREKYCSVECYRGTNDSLPPRCFDCNNILPHRKRKRCEPCAKNHKRQADRDKPRSRAKIEYNCRECGKSFHPIEARKNKYCSHACAFEGLRADRRFAREKKQAEKPGPFCRVWLCSCRVCQKAFFSNRRYVVFCSEICLKADARRKEFERNSKRKKLISRPCKACGREFAPAYGDQRRVFCSHECSNRVGRLNRRMRERGSFVESVDPFRVFERDGWRCQICHRPTPRRLRGSIEDMAPELDHIVPLAKGGEHSYRNTQCACRACNGAKGDKVYGQLPLLEV